MEVYMLRLRSLLARTLALVLSFYVVPPASAANPSIGVLTLATHAHLDEAVAFPGLSVFEGERLSTEAEGRMGVRAGHTTLTLGGQTEVSLIPLGGGFHVDMSQGSLHFAVPDNEPIEIHVAEAMVSSEGASASQGSVGLLGPRILQITAERGDLNFRFRDQSQTLPQGQTYRIYLDAPPASADGAAGGSGTAAKAASANKVLYFIVGVGVAGVTAWGIHDALRSGSSPISPAKPDPTR
jgi:hypothetical protein